MEEISIKTKDGTKLYGYLWMIDKNENTQEYG